MINHLPKHGKLFYTPSFFPKEEADRLFEQLLSDLAWEQRPIMMYGKEILQPRKTVFHGDEWVSYTYSGKTMHAQGWTSALEYIKEQIEAHTRMSFNCVLCNLYEDGQDYMGWHSDDEPELGDHPSIASLSLGAPRMFQLRRKESGNEKVSLALEHGSLCFMTHETQEYWQHRVPKSKEATRARINLTFRYVNID